MGSVVIEGDDVVVRLIAVSDGHQRRRSTSANAVARAANQLEEYFDGARRAFDLSLADDGTPFQREVWRALSAIPYGQVQTYRDIAHSIGRPRAMRAVGNANGANPFAIVVPCHRVVAANGIGGYAGGGAWKQALLTHEGITIDA
jgi:methylated-DNA-[protein]-cysteine S-methyltransferase